MVLAPPRKSYFAVTLRMVSWFDGEGSRFGVCPHSSVTPHSCGATATCHMSRSHRSPAQIDHQQPETFGRLRCSLEPRKIELFKNRFRGDSLDAVVTNLASDITEGSSPRIRWFYGLAVDSQALDEGLLQHIRHQRALELHPVVTGHVGLSCCNRSRDTWTAVHMRA